MGDPLSASLQVVGERPHCMWWWGKTVSDVVNPHCGCGGRRLHQSGEPTALLQVVEKTALLREERIITRGLGIYVTSVRMYKCPCFCVRVFSCHTYGGGKMNPINYILRTKTKDKKWLTNLK